MSSPFLKEVVLRGLLEGYEKEAHQTLVSDSGFEEFLLKSVRATPETNLRELTVMAGAILFEEGTPGDAIYIVRSGVLAALKGDLADPVLLSYNCVGQVIGEMALLEDRPRSVSIVALFHSELVRIDARDFQATLDRYPSLAIGLFKALSARLRLADKTRTIASVVERQLQERLVHVTKEKECLEVLQNYQREFRDLLVHDLRNPLGSIFLGLETLRAGMTATQLESKQNVLYAVDLALERLDRLTGDLLDAARMEAGMLVLNLETVSIPDLIRPAQVQASVLAERKAICINNRIPENLPPIKIDAGIIERVVINLLDNAIKYSPAGGDITILAGVEGEQIWLSVSDKGGGIPEVQWAQIFESFTQLEASQTHLRVGHGMGLRFCHLALEAHAGRIWVERS
ncbi:MAG: ATP-binding protein, partial [Verrucomicrobiota bacterium]